MEVLRRGGERAESNGRRNESGEKGSDGCKGTLT